MKVLEFWKSKNFENLRKALKKYFFLNILYLYTYKFWLYKNEALFAFRTRRTFLWNERFWQKLIKFYVSVTTSRIGLSTRKSRFGSSGSSVPEFANIGNLLFPGCARVLSNWLSFWKIGQTYYIFDGYTWTWCSTSKLFYVSFLSCAVPAGSFYRLHLFFSNFCSSSIYFWLFLIQQFDTKGQLISKELLDVWNFPKNQQQKMMKFCPRI